MADATHAHDRPDHQGPTDRAGADVRTPRTPRWLLWSTGFGALLLGSAAFLLWGLNGPAYLLDLIAAYCF